MDYHRNASRPAREDAIAIRQCKIGNACVFDISTDEKEAPISFT